MASRKRSLHCSVLLVMLVCLAGKAGAAVPVEISHYNSNTFANLNTLTSTGSITFTIAYDSPGDIKWYKDNALVQTDTSTTAASHSTAWTAADYGMVRQLRVNATGIDGTSIDTIWNVEVQQMGTATIAKHVFPQSTDVIDYMPTLWVAGGWTNLPSLYLVARDTACIEYVAAKTYSVKLPVYLDGAALYITTDTAKEVKLRGLPNPDPARVYKPTNKIGVAGNGKIVIDKVNVYGWNTQSDSEITANDESPIISSNGDNTMDITNSNFRHIMAVYYADQSSGDIVNNNSFLEGTPYNIKLTDNAVPDRIGAKGQVITNNTLIGGNDNNIGGSTTYIRSCDNSGVIIKDNKCIAYPGSASANVAFGSGTSFIGNEASYSRWNIVDGSTNIFSKYNNLHDNMGKHNGFNMPQGVSYYLNEYCHHFTDYAGFYIQAFGPEEADWQRDIYIFNSYVKHWSGIKIVGGADSYIYNYYSDGCLNDVQMGADNIIYRKSDFLSSYPYALRILDLENTTDGWQYIRNVFAIDCLFSEKNNWDYYIYSDPQESPEGHPVMWSINSFRKNSDGSIRRPVSHLHAGHNGETRNYAYLDICVRDGSGNPVSGATVAVTPLTDANYPAIDVHLPPPPPDLNEYPSEQLPMPSTGTFAGSTTGADGHIPSPNYGRSANIETVPALLFNRETASGSTTSYQYRVTAARDSQTVYKDITPDDSWLREDPCQPAKTIVLTFDQPAGKYALNVNGGTGSGLYDQGQSAAIAAGAAPAGKVFDKWIGDTTTVNNVNSASTYIIVPSSDVSVTAYFKDITYHLTVVGGTGSGDYPAGRITVADAAPANGAQVFYKWTGDTEHVVSPAVYSSTLIMPAHDVTVTATYRNPTSYSCRLTVADGQGTDFYAPGDNVTITAATAPSGKVFDHWEGDTASLADAGSSNTTLTGIPDDYLIVYPVYRTSGLTSSDANLSNLSVSGGTLLPRFSSYISGFTGIVGNGVASVTITPTASQGTRAAITVNGRTVNSGSASGPITLNATGSTLITIVVTAPDTTTTKTYTISVTRTPLATGYTLTAPNPASGEIGAASGNFTVTPNGKYTGTITITPAGGGLSTPLNLTFSNSDEPRTFTITPAAAGTVTLTPSNSGGLTDPAAITYTAYMPGTLRNASWNYPNPVNFTKTDRMTIAYTVARECNVYICLYTLSGELVKVFVDNKTTAPGKYYMDWYGDNGGGEKAASGVYLYVAKIGDDIVRKKIVLLR